MDRREAIDILVGVIATYSEEENEALDLAVEALEREIEYGQMVVDLTKGEKVDDWVYDEDESATTTDCISRAKAIKEVKALPDTDNGYSDAYDKACIIGVLEELPSVAPKPVGDCISREKTKLAIARAIKDANDNRLDIGCCIYNAIDDVPEEKQNLLSDDTISRADTIKALCQECKVFLGDGVNCADCTEVAIVKGMPPVKLKNPCDSLLTAESDECKEQKSKLDCISRQDAIEALCRECCYDCHDCREVEILESLPPVTPTERAGEWIHVSEPPKDGRNVFLAHGTNNFKSCCIGHYDHSMKIWYEEKNFFAKPIYDCKYWCDIPKLPDMGDSQFDK